MTLLVILVINIVIVWYLLQNRQRLFRHHQHYVKRTVAYPNLPVTGGLFRGKVRG